MGNVNVDGIWTPDEDDTQEPDVWSAAMADSISQGLGKRMALQESRASMAAQVGGTFTITGAGSTEDMGIILPVQITGSRDFVTDMELLDGIVTVTVPGLYLITLTVTASVTAASAPDVPLDASLYVNTTGEIFQPFVTNPAAYSNATIVTTLMLQAGDTVYGRLRVGAGRTDSQLMRNAVLKATIMYATE